MRGRRLRGARALEDAAGADRGRSTTTTSSPAGSTPRRTRRATGGQRRARAAARAEQRSSRGHPHAPSSAPRERGPSISPARPSRRWAARARRHEVVDLACWTGLREHPVMMRDVSATGRADAPADRPSRDRGGAGHPRNRRRRPPAHPGGREEVEAGGPRPRVHTRPRPDAILSSPLPRAWRTAEIAAAAWGGLIPEKTRTPSSGAASTSWPGAVDGHRDQEHGRARRPRAVALHPPRPRSWGRGTASG